MTPQQTVSIVCITCGITAFVAACVSSDANSKEGMFVCGGGLGWLTAGVINAIAGFNQ